MIYREKLNDFQNKERNYLWRQYAQAHKDSEDLKMSKHKF